MRKILACFVATISLGLLYSHAQSTDAHLSDPTVRAKSDIQTLTMQLELYQAMNGFLPSTEQGLLALVAAPTTNPKPTHWMKLIGKAPLDPWGHPYLYKNPGIHNPNSYDIYSAGPDGKPDTNDDIGNW